jgi:hypothetical protein
MSDLIPVTDELLDRAREDRGFRYQLLSEHLDELMVAMSRARNRIKTEINADPETSRDLQEGARLAVKLTEILHRLSTRVAR